MKIASVLLRKICYLSLIPIALGLVLLARLLRPWILIRFGSIDSTRIGHFCANTEIYLCQREAGPKALDLLYYIKPVCNHQLKRMWQRVMPFSRFGLLAALAAGLNRKVPGGYAHTVILNEDRDLHGVFYRNKSRPFFTPREEKIGRSRMLDLGVPEGSPFVCFHVRDEAYLNLNFSRSGWDYHNYRNCTLSNYIPAIEELTRQGILAIRMGFGVKEAMSNANPMVIDYAAKKRSEFMDIYLSAKCYFFIGSTAGLAYVPAIFRKPVVTANFIPLRHALTSIAFSLFIPKKLWLRKEGRFLSFREVLGSVIADFSLSEDYEKYGIEAIENTPEEITAAVLEMDKRLSGKWQISEEDEELQRKFWSLYKDSCLHKNIPSRIGADFLRQNRELLN